MPLVPHDLPSLQDAATCSDEAMMKWKERRCAEVTDGRREVPNGMSSMLGEMFR